MTDSPNLTTSQWLGDADTRFRALSDATFEAIFLSTRGICIDANQSASRLLGYTHDELIGIFGTDVIAEEYRELVRDKMLSGAEEPYEAIAVRKDGSTFPCEIQGRMFNVGGRPIRVTALRDISQRKALEMQLLHSQKLEAIGELAGGVAHDFNNLLTAISGNAELLQHDGTRADDRESILDIRLAAEQGSRLTRQLLTFCRREMPAAVKLDLGEIFQKVMLMLRRLIPENITLDLDLPPRLPPIVGDAGSFEQVLINLVLNARDALLERSGCAPLIEIRVFQKDPEWVVWEVEDNGAGMNETLLQKIFDPFVTTKAPGKGTGLGLSVAHGIVLEAQGRIRAQSTLGVGTTMSVSWPVARETEALTPDHTEQARDNWDGTERILVAEDEQMIRACLSRVLSRSGYDARFASSAEEAIQLLEEKTWIPDLIVSDLVMPGIGGRALESYVRTESRELPVVLMSGYRSDENSAPTDSLFVAKPFSLTTFLQTIRRALDGRERPSADRSAL